MQRVVYTKRMTKLPFLKGRVYELVVCSLALVATVVVMLQLPFTIDGYDDRVTTAMFSLFAISCAVAVIMLRHEVIRFAKWNRYIETLSHDERKKIDTAPDAFFYRWLFTWLFPLASFLVILPWIIAGVFNSDDMNTIGSMVILFFAPWVMYLIGSLVAAFVVYPIETTIRGAIKLIATGGKEGLGQLSIGAYCLLVLGFIVSGSLAASSSLVGGSAQADLFAALLGLPGGYVVKDQTLLWVTRVLFVAMIVIPLVFKNAKKKHPESSVVRDIDSKILY